jgi:hypothetical protein
MQTFLPYPDFVKSAKCLDMKRLGKQRVEAYQILQCLLGEKDGWHNHPAVKMWKGHETALADYGCTICQEWVNRGYKDTCRDKIWNMWAKCSFPMNVEYPKWLGNEEFHASHRSNLLRKNPEHYSQFGWTENDNMEYVWPTKLD